MEEPDESLFAPENEERFWQEVDRVLRATCESYEQIDDALRTWLRLTATYRSRNLDREDDVAACAEKLLASPLFAGHGDYVRTQIIYSLLEEEDAGPLHAIACFLLLSGRMDEASFPRMIEASCFHRLLELISGTRDLDPQLHRLLLQVMYEMSGMERLRAEDLLHVDDGFVEYLFRIIEGVSDDVHDPYHYPTIRVLLVLNEQYMLASTDSASDPMSPTAPLTNRVIKCLSLHGPSFRTFGENIILLLNRETETSLQLLILKLLYLLFTTKATYEYFYTNDLKVLLDVIIRNLMDLPNEKMSLRHTYLRVMYPLLAHTQLSLPPHYKQEEIVRVLNILKGSGSAHFAPADETTLRLVDRVSKVAWLADLETEAEAEAETGAEAGGEVAESPSEGPGDADLAKKFLGISLSRSETSSSISVVDVAAVMEKPGVQTPSRKAGTEAEQEEDEAAREEADMLIRAKKVPPQVPKPRRGAAAVKTMASRQANGAAPKVPPKVPPKAPPPRRWGRMKVVVSQDSVDEAES